MNKAPIYPLDVSRDVDTCQGMSQNIDYILNLHYGWRFSDEICHVRGYDSMKELRAGARKDTVPCDCAECAEHVSNTRQLQ